MNMHFLINFLLIKQWIVKLKFLFPGIDLAVLNMWEYGILGLASQ